VIEAARYKTASQFPRMAINTRLKVKRYLLTLCETATDEKVRLQALSHLAKVIAQDDKRRIQRLKKRIVKVNKEAEESKQLAKEATAKLAETQASVLQVVKAPKVLPKTEAREENALGV
jgi:hypothetical protein